jgi:hypothetical protein
MARLIVSAAVWKTTACYIDVINIQHFAVRLISALARSSPG